MKYLMARPDMGKTHVVFSLKVTKFFDYLGAAVLAANSPEAKFGVPSPKRASEAVQFRLLEHLRRLPSSEFEVALD